MKLASGFLATFAVAQDCVDIDTTTEFLAINHGSLKSSCSTAMDTECAVRCNNGYQVSHQAYTVKATCTCSEGECNWSYGSYGYGDGNKNANFGCCEKPDKSFGSSWSKAALARNFQLKFIEADDSYALLGFKIKAKKVATTGYSFLMIFESVLPDDVEFETFTRVSVTDIYRDTR